EFPVALRRGERARGAYLPLARRRIRGAWRVGARVRSADHSRPRRHVLGAARYRGVERRSSGGRVERRQAHSGARGERARTLFVTASGSAPPARGRTSTTPTISRFPCCSRRRLRGPWTRTTRRGGSAGSPCG